MQKKVLEVLKRGIFLILHFGRQVNDGGGGGGYSHPRPPPGYATVYMYIGGLFFPIKMVLKDSMLTNNRIFAQA